jgi:hypothetical protein
MSNHKERRLVEKLLTTVQLDFPAATEILVGFPDAWELIGVLKRAEGSLYAAALPVQVEQADDEHFSGLSPAINRTLKQYHHYKLFEPWPTPVLPVSWDPVKGEGRVERGGRLDVRLQPIAEAQAWTGGSFGVLWECYSFETRRPPHWQAELAAFWQTVEADLKVVKIFTQPQDPAFAEEYTDFLSSLGYQPDAAFPAWWSKERSAM